MSGFADLVLNFFYFPVGGCIQEIVDSEVPEERCALALCRSMIVKLIGRRPERSVCKWWEAWKDLGL